MPTLENALLIFQSFLDCHSRKNKSTNMNHFRNWILAARPKTLTAAIVPIMVAMSYAYFKTGDIAWGISICALLSSLCIQIGTNFVNDAQDFKKGADTEERLGPKRVTQSGDFTYKTVMVAAALMFAGSVAFGLPLVIAGGAPILLIGLVSVLCGYAYTAGPFPLAYRGWGDAFVIIFFGVVPVLGMIFLNTGEWHVEAALPGLQIGLLAAVLIAINNLRDVKTDEAVGKRTMAVRLGVKGAKKEIAVLMFLPFLLNIYWFYQNLSLWRLSFLPFLALPLAIFLLKKVQNTPPGREYNAFLAKAAALHMVFGVLLSLGFLVVR